MLQNAEERPEIKSLQPAPDSNYPWVCDYEP